MSNLKKIFFGLLFSLLLLISTKVFALTSGWIDQSVYFNGGLVQYWYNIASSSDGSRLAAVPITGDIFTATNCGEGLCTWTDQGSGFGEPGSQGWYDIASDGAGDKLAVIPQSGDIWLGDCTIGSCNTAKDWQWTDQGASPGSKSWESITSSFDGSILGAGGSGTDLYVGTGCGSGTCTWHDQGGTPGNGNWRAMAESADGSKIAAALISGDIWIGTNCTLGTCTWHDQGTSLGEPGVQSWRSLSFSSDGSKLAGAVVGGDLWIGTSCTTGTCSTWTNQATDTSGSWYSVAFSSDGSRLAATELGGDIWLGSNCTGGLCTWADQGTTTFSGVQSWRSIASDSTGTKIAAVIDGVINPNPGGTAHIWTFSPLVTPSVTTGSVSGVTQTTAIVSSMITAGGATTEGVNYGTTNSYGSVASASGNFFVGTYLENITGLSCGTTYHYEAFVTNSVGTTTGSDATFTTSTCSPVSVSGITVTGVSLAPTVPNGGTLQMNAAVTPSNASNPTVTWSVTNGTGKAIINASTGLLTGTVLGTVTVTATATDGSGLSGTELITVTVPPTVTAFVMPTSSLSMTVPVTTFTGSASVTGYLITGSSSTPSQSDPNWSATAPSSFTFSGAYTQVAHAWVRDAAGNISGSSVQTINTEEFLDTTNIASSSGVSFGVNEPTKSPSNPIFGSPLWTWDNQVEFNTVLQLAANDFRLWYSTYNVVENFLGNSYATSNDGLNWVKPILGQVQYPATGGDTNNNLMIGNGYYGNAVSYDPAPANPNQRFVETMDSLLPGESNSVSIFTSSDGTNWSLVQTLDTSGAKEGYSIVKRPDGRWLLYYEYHHGAFSNEFNGSGPLRNIGVYLSDTTSLDGSWTDQGIVIAGVPENQKYDIGVKYEGGLYYGFVMQFNEQSLRIDAIQLYISRDGLNWTLKDPNWLPNSSTVGDWDYGMETTGENLVTVGNTWRYYYSADSELHDGSDGIGRLGYATVGYQRIGQISGTGNVITTAITTPSDEVSTLDLNADASAGTLSCELLSTGGSVLSGYSESNFAPITTNTYDAVATWGGSQLLPMGLSFKVRCDLSNAVLYSYNIETVSSTQILTITPSSDATLSSLATNEGAVSPTFSSDVTSYSESVASNVTGIIITPMDTQGYATMKINSVAVPSNSGSVFVPLNFGSNVVTILVTAQDGLTTQTYTLTVSRMTEVEGGHSPFIVPVIVPTAPVSSPSSYIPISSPFVTNPIITPSVIISPTLVFKRTLEEGETGPDVKELQQFLNAHGFVVSKTGAGSPGKETTYFGSGTDAALIRFQNVNASKILTPLGLKKATGIFGPATRKVVEEIK